MKGGVYRMLTFQLPCSILLPLIKNVLDTDNYRRVEIPHG